MDKLYIVRHGPYDSARMLTPDGWEQMTILAGKIHSRLNGASVKILASSAPRAADSARAIGNVLKCPVEEHEALWNDKGHGGNLEESQILIDAVASKTDAVIVVTHLEYTEYLTDNYLTEFGIDGYCHAVEKSEAWELNRQDRTIKRISP